MDPKSFFCSLGHIVITFDLWPLAPSCWKWYRSPNCSRRKFCYHSFFMAVFLGKIVRAHSIDCDATSHMNGLRILYFWHETGLMVEVALPLSFSHPELLITVWSICKLPL